MHTYIESIYAKDIGKYKEVKANFNSRFNFLVGANGCGKTTLLKYIAIICNPQGASIFRYGSNATVWADYYDGDKKIRIGLGKGWVRNGEEYRQAGFFGWTPPEKDSGVAEAISCSQLEEKKVLFAPLILGAYRRIEYRNISGMRKESVPVENRKVYRNKGIEAIGGGSLPDVKQWMINRYFEIEKPWAGAFKNNWDWVINNLSAVSPYGDGFKFKEIKQDLEPVFTLYGKECYLEELSAGFQAILSLIFAIVEWIEAVNEKENALVEKAAGTVLIDELDVHLHPEWQLIVRDMLDRIFPNLQFIITTHSPHIIASAHPGEIIIIPREEKCEIKAINKAYSGWKTDEILEDVMDVRNLEKSEYNALLKETMTCILNKDIGKVKENINKLENIVHPNNIVVSELRIMLSQMMLED